MVIGSSVSFVGFNTPSSQQDEESGKVCIANISLHERQKRLRFGVTQFVTTLIVLGSMLALDVNPLWRLPLLFMFWPAVVGYFQARDTSRGSRKFGDTEERIQGSIELKQVRRQARWVIFKAFLAALPLTVIAFILP